MKVKSLVAACGMAFASQSFALTPGTTPDVSLFISGASAQQLTLGQLSVSMFVNGPAGSTTATDVFFDDASSGKNYRAYFGVMRSSSDIPTSLRGKKVIIHNRAKGGSVYGVNPVALATPTTRMDVNGAAGNCSDTGTTDATTGQKLWKCKNTVNTVPDAGVSDVEPAMFVGINVAPGDTELTEEQRGRLIVGSQFGAPFGAILTDNATGIIDNLNRPQATALMTGTVADWSVINPAAASAGLTDTNVIICRRVPGSGTQASTNAYLFGFPCTPSALTPADHFYSNYDPATGQAFGQIVIENSGSGQLAACMTAAQNGTGTITVTKNGVPTVVTAAIDITNGTIGEYLNGANPNQVILPGGEIGIGIMGFDRPAQSGETYHFSSIDGVAPTLANAIEGKYNWIAENGYQYRGVPVDSSTGELCTSGATCVQPPSGAQADLIGLVKTRSADPTVLGGSGDPAKIIPGIAALTENGYVAPATFSSTYPVMKVGNFSNTCLPLQQLQ